MARQRLRAQMTWESARGTLKKLERELAQQACTGEAINTIPHWRKVGAYLALSEILWECDK